MTYDETKAAVLDVLVAWAVPTDYALTRAQREHLEQLADRIARAVRVQIGSPGAVDDRLGAIRARWNPGDNPADVVAEAIRRVVWGDVGWLLTFVAELREERDLLYDRLHAEEPTE